MGVKKGQKKCDVRGVKNETLCGIEL